MELETEKYIDHNHFCQ